MCVGVRSRGYTAVHSLTKYVKLLYEKKKYSKKNFFQTRINAVCQEGRDVVTINEWTDRIYQNTPQEHIITNVVSGRKMRVQKYNFPDTVIWNPWVQRAKELTDFGDDEYPNMVCVESGHVSSPVILLPGTAFEASQILQVT